jgi:cobalt-zinc-cadmium efflux system outer membrane protein
MLSLRGRGLFASWVLLVSACATNYGRVSVDPPPRAPADRAADAPEPAEPTRLLGAAAGEVATTPGAALALPQLLRYAERHAPALLLARARRSRARAALVAADVWLPGNPQASLAIGPRISGGGGDLDLQLSLSQPIAIGGQRGLRRDAARKMLALSAAQAGDAAWQLRRQIVSAYLRVLAAQRELRIAEQQRDFASELSRIAQKRLKAGAISPLQPKLAEVEVQQAQQSVLVAQGNLLGQRIALGALVGWSAAKPPRIRGAFRHQLRLPPKPRLVALAQARQPAIAARKRAVELAQSQLALADRRAWPNPSVGLSYQLEGDPSGSGSRQHVLFFTLGLSLPLWQTNQAQRARARADLLIARAEQRVATQLLSARVARALTQVRSASARVKLFEGKILPSYQKNLRLLRRAFELGEVGLLSVLVGRGRILTSRRAALAAQVDYGRALLEIEALCGPLHTLPGAVGAKKGAAR